MSDQQFDKHGVFVPQDVWDWLMGEGKDFVPSAAQLEGSVFTPGRYWWRSELRRRIEESAPSHEVQINDDTPQESVCREAGQNRELRTAAAGVSSPSSTRQSDSTCWLVERPGPEWLSLIGPAPAWTKDAHEAIRYKTRKAANELIGDPRPTRRLPGFEQAFASEHVFIRRDDSWIGGVKNCEHHAAVSATVAPDPYEVAYANSLARDGERWDGPLGTLYWSHAKRQWLPKSAPTDGGGA